MRKLIFGIANWVQEDWRGNPLRCILEVFAWFLSISCSVVMMLTVPEPPFLILYPLFIIQCAIFAWAAWTRQSSGMLANYVLLVSIDTVGLARLIFFT